MALNETHDSALRSWVESAQVRGTDFPIQNLPFAVFRRRDSAEAFRGGVAIGDQVLDLKAALAGGAFDEARVGPLASQALQSASAPSLNELMSLGPASWSALRLVLSRALSNPENRPILQTCLVQQADAEFTVPAHIGDYTDFYTSIHHATAVGKLMRPDNPLLPNYPWVPIGYHGRTSSIGISGQIFARPCGQRMPAGGDTPVVGPSERLDYELELGIFVGPGNALGSPIDVLDAEAHVFGLCLLNDWSARDIQGWEYQPLGPFLGKSFATTISPWIVTLEALAPYRVAWSRSADYPAPLKYLCSADLAKSGSIDMQVEVWLRTEGMRSRGLVAHRLSRSNYKETYWCLAQLVAHHTVNGCNLRSGDLLGTGTLSGPRPEEAGSLLELTVGGTQSITLPNGEVRRFLEDGDEIILRGWCECSDRIRIGFGEAVGRVCSVALAPHYSDSAIA